MHKASLLTVLGLLAVSSSVPILAADNPLVCGNTRIFVTPGTIRGGTPVTDF
jgi:hypothetical protein